MQKPTLFEGARIPIGARAAGTGTPPQKAVVAGGLRRHCGRSPDLDGRRRTGREQRELYEFGPDIEGARGNAIAIAVWFGEKGGSSEGTAEESGEKLKPVIFPLGAPCRMAGSPRQQPAAGRTSSYLLSRNLYLSGQRSKTRLSTETKGLRPSATPLRDTAPRSAPDGVPASDLLQGCGHHGPARQQPPDAMRPRSSGESPICAAGRDEQGVMFLGMAVAKPTPASTTYSSPGSIGRRSRGDPPSRSRARSRRTLP